MVYTGKPSRGCGMCKSRRIKCDEKRPTCGNCKKSGRECPGYPDEFDLVFRDENKAMAKKAKKITVLVPSRSSTDDLSSSHTSPHLSPAPSQDSSSTTLQFTTFDFNVPPVAPNSNDNNQLILFPPTSLTPQPLDQTFDFDNFMWNFENALPTTIQMPPEYEAVPFFFKNFIALPQQAESTRGFLEYLVPLYNKAKSSSVLHLATSAVAMATVGQYPGRAELIRLAVSTYGKALKKLNDDLKDPIMSKSDETVIAILMFSLYETIMSTDDSITAWGNHVDGAVALTKMRGTAQFNDEMSHSIFRAVRTMMITSCVQRSKPIDDFPGTNGWVGTGEFDEENVANRLTLICIDLPSLRARANLLTTTPYDPAHDHGAKQILGFAQMVDKNLEQWYNTLPTEWQHTTIGLVAAPIPQLPTPSASLDDPGVAEAEVEEATQWPGEQHVYNDVPLASIVNDYRVCRIFCRRVIIACLEWLGRGIRSNAATTAAEQAGDEQGEYKGEYETSVFIVQKMVDDICACVPFHMDYELQPVAKSMGQEQNAAEAFGGYSLVWPLYVAANAETVPQEQRDWAFGRLSVIGTKFGLSSAQVLVLARRHILTCGPMFP